MIFTTGELAAIMAADEAVKKDSRQTHGRMSRKCEIYECSRRPGNPCCADCDDTECPNRCLNGPERCFCCREDGLKDKPADAGEGPVGYYLQGHTDSGIAKPLDTALGERKRDMA